MTIFFILPLIPLTGGIFTLVNYFRQKDTSLLINVFSGLLFACAWLAAFKYKAPLSFGVAFFKSENNVIYQIELDIDNLALFMVVLVSSISFFVHQFASRYLRSDLTQGRFMAQLSLLTAAVIFLVMGGNLLTIFLAWEFVGLTLYLLLNHYHYDQRANRAAKKEFIINRLGDMAFMVALCLCNTYFKSSELSVLASSPIVLWQFLGWYVSVQYLVVFLIFIAIMTKSAQFPFHIWLPDTMQAPTPVSAMMHAGIINIGGFLLARLSPYIPLSSFLSDFIYTVGIVSVLCAAFFGLSQHDVKRQLAYSTMGQMGYMIVQAGLGFFTAAVFHLAAHGFFKGYLFLSAGSQIGHKYEYHSSSLRKSLTAIKIFILTFVFIGLANWLLYGSLTSSIIIIGLFISLAIGQYMSEVSMLSLTRVQKFIIYVISLLFLLVYTYLVNSVDDYLHPSVVNQVANVSWYKLAIALLVVLLQLLIWLQPAFKNYFSVKFTLRAYHLSVNKFFIEEKIRKYFLQPYEHLSLWVNHTLTAKVGKISLAKYIISALSIIILAINMLHLSSTFNNIHMLLILLLMVILLIAAYRANTLPLINYYLFFAQLNMGSIGVNSLTSGFTRDLSILQLLNSTLIFIGIDYICRQHGKAKHVSIRLGNKLIWASFYYCILMFLWIGIPFTASFSAEMYIFHDLIKEAPAYVFIAALAFVFLAMAILNALQEYVFNPDSIFIQRDIKISFSGHLLLVGCIGFNLFNGFAPSWLVHQLYSLVV